MANTICHDGYCEPVRDENSEDNSQMTFGDKVIIGGVVLVMVAFLAISWYGVSLGLYPDPTLIP